MIEISPATEHEVVLAFLRAEIDSPRYGQLYSHILNASGLRRSDLIDNADLDNLQQNKLRHALLGEVRGYSTNQYLFQGFPSDIQWRRVRLEASDLRSLKYGNFPTWVSLSGGTRFVRDGARNINSIQTAENVNANIHAIADEVRRGRSYPELIAVEGDEAALILVEGHARATAYLLAAPHDPIDLFLGLSPLMNRWSFY